MILAKIIIIIFLTSDSLIQELHSLYTGFSNENGLVTSQVTQPTPKTRVVQGPKKKKKGM